MVSLREVSQLGRAVRGWGDVIGRGDRDVRFERVILSFEARFPLSSVGGFGGELGLSSLAIGIQRYGSGLYVGRGMHGRVYELHVCIGIQTKYHRRPGRIKSQTPRTGSVTCLHPGETSFTPSLKEGRLTIALPY
jgi:hypothetical protein